MSTEWHDRGTDRPTKSFNSNGNPFIIFIKVVKKWKILQRKESQKKIFYIYLPSKPHFYTIETLTSCVALLGDFMKEVHKMKRK